MNVTASGTIDANSTKILTYVSAFGKTNPKKKLLCYFLLFFLLDALIILEGVLWGFNTVIICLIGIPVLGILFELYAYFLLPKIRVKAAKKLIGCINTYEFRDDCFTVTTTGIGNNGTSTLNYDFIKKVYETNDYMFLIYQNNTALIVDKKDIQNNEDSILQKRLECQIPKYVKCNF